MEGITVVPVPVAVQKTLDSGQPTRIAVFVRTKSPLCLQSPAEVVKTVCSTFHITDNGRPTLLAIEKWDRLDVLVLDVFHAAYNWSTAHHEANLPVVLVDYGKRYSVVKEAGPDFRRQVNEAVAREHDLNGWDTRPPYVSDQRRTRSQVPTYPNLRHMVTLTPKSVVYSS